MIWNKIILTYWDFICIILIYSKLSVGCCVHIKTKEILIAQEQNIFSQKVAFFKGHLFGIHFLENYVLCSVFLRLDGRGGRVFLYRLCFTVFCKVILPWFFGNSEYAQSCRNDKSGEFLRNLIGSGLWRLLEITAEVLFLFLFWFF